MKVNITLSHWAKIMDQPVPRRASDQREATIYGCEVVSKPPNTCYVVGPEDAVTRLLTAIPDPDK